MLYLLPFFEKTVIQPLFGQTVISKKVFFYPFHIYLSIDESGKL